MPREGFKKVFIFLDTDKHASPFDILTTIDVLPDAAILKYENVTVDNVENMVQDMMFPRGPKGVKHTKIFLNGRDLNRVNGILQKIKECMFEPFELSVVVDPRGAYTTATAAVAKTLKLSLQEGFGNLEGKKVTVLAGTGPVGQTAARLYASEGAEVTVTSRSIDRASSVAEKVNEDIGGDKVKGVKAGTDQEVGKAIQPSEIVLSAGAAGIQLLPLATLKEYGKNCKIVADINAVPPLGVEGLKPKSEGQEIASNVLGIGALAIGNLKNNVEAQLIQRAAEEPKGIFDYKIAYEISKNTVLRKLEKNKES